MGVVSVPEMPNVDSLVIDDFKGAGLAEFATKWSPMPTFSACWDRGTFFVRL